MVTAHRVRPEHGGIDLPRHVTSPGLARVWTRAALRRWGITGPILDDAELVVSELVTNAYLHALGSKIRVTVAHLADGSVQLVVRDKGPACRSDPRGEARAAEEHGRGLIIAAGLSAECGHTLDKRGHCTASATLAPSRSAQVRAWPTSHAAA